MYYHMDLIEIVNNHSGSPQSIVAIYQALIISYYWGGSIFKGSQVWKKKLVSINHLTAVKIFKEKMKQKLIFRYSWYESTLARW